MDIIVKPPFEFLSRAVANEIRNEADAAERDGFLTTRQQQIIFDHQWFNMYVPKAYGGLQLSLPEILRIEESLAWADGSTAWVVTLCSGAAWFSGFLDPDLARDIFFAGNTCLAGSGAVTGTAVKNGDSFVINGHWKYATGSPMATAFTMNCQVIENGFPLLDDAGVPMIKSFILNKGEVCVDRMWKAMGMIATGSHSFEAKNVVVPPSRAFIIHPNHAISNDPLFQYPFLQLAETTLAVNLSGMAARFLELCEEIIFKRAEQSCIYRFHFVRNQFDELRNIFYFHADHSWRVVNLDRTISDEVLEKVSINSHALVHGSRTVMNNLYPMCGLQAAAMGSEINRVWRNFHTAAQHSLFRSKHRETKL